MQLSNRWAKNITMEDKQKENMLHAEFRVARTKEELELCYGIVHREWERIGYVRGGYPQRYSVYNALPTTTTFVGVTKPGGEVFMTATLIPDSAIGMPIDVVFKDKLAEYRAAGKKIAEVSMLAFDSFADSTESKEIEGKRLTFLVQMFRLILSYARRKGVELFCVKVHTRHAALYEKLMFDDFGEIRMMPLLSDMPVRGKILDIAKATHFCEEPEHASLFVCSSFFGSSTDEPLSAGFSEKYRFTEQDLMYFFVEKRSIFQEISLEELAVIKSLYPEVDFTFI